MALWHDLIPKLHKADGDPQLDLDPCRHALHAEYDYDDVGLSNDELTSSLKVCEQRRRPHTSPVTVLPGHRRHQGLSLTTTTDASWSRRAGKRISTSPSRSSSVTGRGGSRAVAPSRRRAGDTSTSEAASSVTRSDYRLHLVVTASVGGCMLAFNITLFFCLYCHRRRRRRRQQLTTSSITKLRYTTAKTFDEDARRAWQQQQPASRGQAESEIDDELDGGAVWQSQQRHKGHDDCGCARCRCRLKPAGNDCGTTSALYVTEPPLY